MASSFAAGLLIALIFSLIFSSVSIAYFVTEMGINANIPQIVLPNELKSYNSEQDFLNGTFDIGTLTKVSSATWTYIEKVGYVLTGHSMGGENYFYIMNINPDSTKTITNNYKINNSPLNDYSIVIKGNSGISNNEIIVRSDGFHIPTYFITGSYFGERDFIPYPNANKLQNVLIQTIYHEKSFGGTEDSTLTFKFNGNTYQTTMNKDDTFLFFGGTQFYGGVNSKSLGFTLEYFKTGNTISGTGEQKDALSMIADFIQTVLLILFWNLPESVLPLTLNILLIKTQLFGILTCIVVILRG
jgi:hypothetical protein